MRRTLRHIVRRLALRAAATASLAGIAGAQESAESQQRWLDELALLEAYTASKYANFDWKVRRREVDPVALHLRADSLIRRAGSARAARAALVQFVTAFHDGHFSARDIPAARGTDDDTWPLRSLSAARVCKAFGYGSEGSRTAMSRLDGWRDVSLPRLPFAAGVLERDGKRFAVLRIQAFGYEPHGWACEMVWPQVQRTTEGERCESMCEALLRRTIADTMASALAESVRLLTSDQPGALIVDVTGNGGGTEWVSKAVRAITSRPIPAQSVAFIRNDWHARALAQTGARIDSALPSVPPGAWHDTLVVARARVERALQLARTPCDRSTVWMFGADSLRCDGVITGLWTAGAVPYLPPGFAPTTPLALEVYSLARLPQRTGGWEGRLVLVTDRRTASATEQFVAELVDGAGAWTVGERTYGSGCGYTRGAEVLDLPETGLRIRAPDCARIRPDGTNEVAGIAPTHDAGWRIADSAAERMEKVVALLLRSEVPRAKP